MERHIPDPRMAEGLAFRQLELSGNGSGGSASEDGLAEARQEEVAFELPNLTAS